MIDKLFQLVMLTVATLFVSFTSAVLLMFLKVLGMLPSLGSPEKDMIYLFLGGVLGLLAGIAFSVMLVRRDPYYVPHFLLSTFGIAILSIVFVGSVGRSFNLAL